MKFSRLRLNGFKSFVDAVDVPIEAGLTGIVGPNGCGKSNLVEALRFVMGESSYKAMRGGGMEDVIFAGASNRPARNIAEVTLVAEAGAAPSGIDVQPGAAIEVTRRIERDSGSAYRLNGREARARDIQLLFADAATGARSAALVRQGQIAELIAAKPTQRRSILEDAAGIGGLHARRGEAEQRLKAAEQNLERLADLRGEIAGQLDVLRRQARQAIRYRALSADIGKAEAALRLIEWSAARAELAAGEGRLAAAGEALAAATRAQAEAARDEAVAARAIEPLREAAGAASAALARLRHEVAELDREEARRKARRAELTARRGETAADLHRESEIEADAAAAKAVLDEEEARLAAEGDGAAARLEAARAASHEAAERLAEAEKSHSEAAAMLAAGDADRSARQRTLNAGRTRLGRLVEERRALVAQADSLRRERDEAAAIAGRAEAVDAAEADLAAREAAAAEAEAALAGARDGEQRAGASRSAADQAFSSLQVEARTLAKVLDVGTGKNFQPLMDHVDVAAGYEQALVAALGDDLDAALDTRAPAFWGASGDAADDPALPSGVEPLSDFVSGPPELARRLAQIGLVEEEDAEAESLRLAPGQRLVTRGGALWRWDGLRMRADRAAGAARRLEQKNRLAVLAQDLKVASRKAEEMKGLTETARQIRVDAEAYDRECRDALREARRRLDAARAAAREAESRAGRIDTRLSAFEGSIARLDAESAALERECRDVEAALAAMPDPAEARTRKAELEQRVAEGRREASERRLAAETLSHEQAMRSRRLAELATERERWRSRVDRALARCTELKERLAAIETELAATEAEPEAIEEERRRLLREIGRAEIAAREAADALGAGEAGHRRAAERARNAIDLLGQAREARAREEERGGAARARIETVERRVREAFGVAPSGLWQLAGLDRDADLPQADGLQSRLDRLKAERERLGSVNLRAEEEAAELETRMETMDREAADLDQAIARLRQGIHALNREGRERLLAAFAAVNTHFGELFRHLFGGGEAELMLTGSDDPLEAGLEIVARPPGKRPQALTLLSGGEQALTTLSLVFAVFLTNPSPICVLDEVDAPLDDANVERFCALLDNMRERTQTRFLVVTHNPITMARMDRLFGVTMAERGVSQLVSVDLETAERFREAS